MQARCYAENWPLRTAFVISRGARTEAQVVVVEISGDGVTGVGECTPTRATGKASIRCCSSCSRCCVKWHRA
ncbi:hypothetical protein [Microbulbifer taiwanensis]|uniref:hypothetical protein n=1 Tax=Microbulbifer taiwanensis TaxID=986746 RepID=UPI00360C7DED